MPELTLYSYWRSSAAYRVRIALNLKDIPYDIKPVNLLKGEHKHDSYKNINPSSLVPTLAIRKDQISYLNQSIAIIEYLEEIYPQNPLLPVDPILRARVREIVLSIACDIHPVHNLRVLQSYPEHERANRAKMVIEEGLIAVELMVRQTCGICCVGDNITMADVVLVPQLYTAQRWNADLTRFPTLMKVYKKLESIPAFQAAHPDQQIDCPEKSQI